MFVNEGSLLDREGPGKGEAVVLAFVQVLVAGVPLCTSNGLEMHGDRFDGLAALVSLGWLVLGAQVGVLQENPALVEIAVEKGGMAKAGLL